MDILSKSDPFVVLYALNEPSRGKTMKKKIGQTEVIWDNHDPDFVMQFEIDYFFEQVQMFVVEIYDMDDESAPNDLSKQDFIGSIEFVLGHIVSSQDQRVLLPFKAVQGQPKLVITAEERKSSKGATALIKFTGDFQQSTEVFFIVWKELLPGNFKPVYKSEGQPLINGQRSWHECIIDTNLLCNGDH